jgi:cbb3-type cytochrome oxidase subunit 1
MTDFTERATPRLDIAFLMLASGCLIVGICLGIYMGVKEDFQLVAVHTHINLLGWVSLALFGVIYRNYPRLAASRLARAHFWLAAPGALAFPFGLYLMQAHQIHVVMVVGSLFWLLGALVFFMAVAGLALSRSSPAPAMAAGE